MADTCVRTYVRASYPVRPYFFHGPPATTPSKLRFHHLAVGLLIHHFWELANNGAVWAESQQEKEEGEQG